MASASNQHGGPIVPANPANTLGLDYREQAERLPWAGQISDVHTHIQNVEAGRIYLEAADAYGVTRTWSMTQLEQVEAMREAFGQRFGFIAVPNHEAHDQPGTFTSDWLRRIEGFAEKGVKVCKFWAAPRGRDIHDALRMGSAEMREQMRLARSLGMMFMTHVADPDAWFATHYANGSRYGPKEDHHNALRRELDRFHDVPWVAAHMAGSPENLERVQSLLDEFPHLYIDTSATKWMVRELSRRPDELADFLRQYAGRVLFGSDVVARSEDLRGNAFDLYASRYWALRTLFETRYDGPSPIVDPDIALLDASQPEHATAHLRGAAVSQQALEMLYKGTAERLLDAWEAGTWRV